MASTADNRSPDTFYLEGWRYENDPYCPSAYCGRRMEKSFIFSVTKNGEAVCRLAHATDVGTSKWTITDLTDFSVDAWEPSHDTELWKKQRKLHLFVQHTRQGDGERTAEIEPQMIYVLETNMDTNK